MRSGILSIIISLETMIPVLVLQKRKSIQIQKLLFTTRTKCHLHLTRKEVTKQLDVSNDSLIVTENDISFTETMYKIYST